MTGRRSSGEKKEKDERNSQSIYDCYIKQSYFGNGKALMPAARQMIKDSFLPLSQLSFNNGLAASRRASLHTRSPTRPGLFGIFIMIPVEVA